MLNDYARKTNDARPVPAKLPVYARTESGNLVVVGEGFRDADGWVTIDLTRSALPDREVVRVKLGGG